jgi:hypothetical protein
VAARASAVRCLDLAQDAGRGPRARLVLKIPPTGPGPMTWPPPGTDSKPAPSDRAARRHLISKDTHGRSGTGSHPGSRVIPRGIRPRFRSRPGTQLLPSWSGWPSISSLYSRTTLDTGRGRNERSLPKCWPDHLVPAKLSPAEFVNSQRPARIRTSIRPHQRTRS